MAGDFGTVAAYQILVESSEQILMRNTQELNTRLRSSTDTAFPLQARVDADVATDKQVSQLEALKQYAIDLTDPSIVDLTANLAAFPGNAHKKGVSLQTDAEARMHKHGTMRFTRSL